jgi:hypothetical protein
MLLAVPFFIAASILGSIVGPGGSTRAGAVAWFVWLGFVAFRLLRKTAEGGVRTAV